MPQNFGVVPYANLEVFRPQLLGACGYAFPYGTMSSAPRNDGWRVILGRVLAAAGPDATEVARSGATQPVAAKGMAALSA